MCELGEKQTAKICADKFLITNLWRETEVARAVSLFRMALVCISATDDETEKRRLIANFICEGKPVANAVILKKSKFIVFEMCSICVFRILLVLQALS